MQILTQWYKCETCGIEYKYCDWFLEYTNFRYFNKDNLIKYKCLFCNKNYEHEFEQKWKKKFLITYKFFDHNKNTFSFYCCEKVFLLMNIWMIGKKLMKHHYLKQDFYIRLNMEDITDVDYTYAKIDFVKILNNKS